MLSMMSRPLPCSRSPTAAPMLRVSRQRLSLSCAAQSNGSGGGIMGTMFKGTAAAVGATVGIPPSVVNGVVDSVTDIIKDNNAPAPAPATTNAPSPSPASERAARLEAKVNTVFDTRTAGVVAACDQVGAMREYADQLAAATNKALAETESVLGDVEALPDLTSLMSSIASNIAANKAKLDAATKKLSGDP